MKYSFFILGISFLWCFPVLGQAKYEREFRIKKTEFPQSAMLLIKDEIQNARKIRFYKEIDSVTISVEVKFKKDKLNYSVEFDTEGVLQDVEVLIKEIDIPNDAFESINKHLKGSYPKYTIRKIQQQYAVKEGREDRQVIKDAFQNLLLPYINYELIVSCKAKTGRQQFEYLFDAEGNFLSKRKSLPANYDHILY
ncbi:MAG: hypothetical protein HKN52_08080 [Eudoraea sp.]|nr:hypothetical protein [Eudoraea sp.]